MKENVSCTVVSDCVTPWTTVHQARSVRGILQARILEWVAISLSPEDLPDRGVEPRSQHCGHILYYLSRQALQLVPYNEEAGTPLRNSLRYIEGEAHREPE